MEAITVTDPQKDRVFNLKTGGKRLKTIEQINFNENINGVQTIVTKLEVTSAFETLKIILPVKGFWKLGADKNEMQFFPLNGSCGNFKILFV